MTQEKESVENFLNREQALTLSLQTKGVSMATRADSQENSQCIHIHNFRSSLYSPFDRQIRFKVNKIKETIAVSIYRIPENILINNLDPNKVKVKPKATGDLRGPVFNPTTLGKMPFQSAEGLLNSLPERKIYPIDSSPDGTVNSFTINY